MKGDSLETLRRNRREFDALAGTARDHLDAGRLEAAATFAQIAGRLGWMNHTGRFASPELEDVLVRLGSHLAPPVPAAPERAVAPREILHVITQAYQTGGPTRAVGCWLTQDTGRHHRVCLTRQGAVRPPDFLVSQLADNDDLVRLDTRPGGLMARAAALRALSSAADVVLLHTHPYDVVPVIAFAHDGARPPVVVVNHSDHVFWLGASVADIVLNMRDSGQALAISRRGIDPARCAVMARPLMPDERTLGRAEAKRRLGFTAEQVLLVTTADAAKYRPVGGVSFLELVTPVVERNPDVVLVAAGPSGDDSAWTSAAQRTGGRIRAVGRLPDVTELQLAADLYLDSFPFASLTSLLEAGSFGTAAITYRGHPADCAVLGADTPGVDPHVLRPQTPTEFAEMLSRAIADAAWRQQLGEATQRAILDTHTGDGWRASAAAAYALAAQTSGRPVVGPADAVDGALDMLVLEVMEQTGYSEGPAGAVRDNLALLPVAQRLAASARLAREGALTPLRHLVPEWLRPPLGRARRWTRGLGQAARSPRVGGTVHGRRS